MILIAGLGNPGKEYSSNRHNIGFLCINSFARKHNIALDKKQGGARTGTGTAEGIDVVLAKPQTYMNLSGRPVYSLLRKYSLTPDDLIVIHDDLDLPLGKIRIRSGNSSGGHNGIKSIIACLGTQDFIRIRVGISRPPLEGEEKEQTVVEYVLGDFSEIDRPVIVDTVNRVCDAVVCLLTKGLTAAMNKFNQPPRGPLGG
ncbi:MAG: aminoacyl-tRNA hydrolase [Dehalococcoidales bacterium]|nr:aminoacyl-tRNA hydrolase [Dehalococcoidales bacterium]